MAFLRHPLAILTFPIRSLSDRAATQYWRSLVGSGCNAILTFLIGSGYNSTYTLLYIEERWGEKVPECCTPNKKVLSLRRKMQTSACGVIGSRARLRIWCLTTCRFESYQAHRIIRHLTFKYLRTFISRDCGVLSHIVCFRRLAHPWMFYIHGEKVLIITEDYSGFH